MLKAKKINESETFNDGVITILNSKDGVILSEKIKRVPFGYKTVGMGRYWNAYVAGTMITDMISIPWNVDITQKDLVELTSFSTGKKEIFQIKQIQKKMDIAPRCLYLTLTKGAIKYDDKRNDQSTS